MTSKVGLIGLYQQPVDRNDISSVYMISDEATNSLFVFILFPGAYNDVYEIASLTTYLNIFIIPISLNPEYVSDIYRLVNRLTPLKVMVKIMFPEHFVPRNANTLFLNSFVKGNTRTSYVYSNNGFIAFDWKNSFASDNQHDIYCTFGSKRILLTSTYVDIDRIRNLFVKNLVDYVYVPWMNVELESEKDENFLSVIKAFENTDYVSKIIPYGFTHQEAIDYCNEVYPDNMPMTIRSLFIDETLTDNDSSMTWGETRYHSHSILHVEKPLHDHCKENMCKPDKLVPNESYDHCCSCHKCKKIKPHHHKSNCGDRKYYCINDIPRGWIPGPPPPAKDGFWQGADLRFKYCCNETPNAHDHHCHNHSDSYLPHVSALDSSISEITYYCEDFVAWLDSVKNTHPDDCELRKYLYYSDTFNPVSVSSITEDKLEQFEPNVQYYTFYDKLMHAVDYTTVKNPEAGTAYYTRNTNTFVQVNITEWEDGVTYYVYNSTLNSYREVEADVKEAEAPLSNVTYYVESDADFVSVDIEEWEDGVTYYTYNEIADMYKIVNTTKVTKPLDRVLYYIKNDVEVPSDDENTQVPEEPEVTPDENEVTDNPIEEVPENNDNQTPEETETGDND